MADELDKVLTGYQVGWQDCLEEIIRLATEKLKEKVKEMKDANTKEGRGEG